MINVATKRAKKGKGFTEINYELLLTYKATSAISFSYRQLAAFVQDDDNDTSHDTKKPEFDGYRTCIERFLEKRQV